MEILGYIISKTRMQNLLNKEKHDYTLMGLFFEMVYKKNKLVDIDIVPVFTNKVEIKSNGYREKLISNLSDGTTNAKLFNGLNTRDYPDPSEDYIYRKLQIFKDNADHPNFFYFDAHALQISLNDQVNHFIVSGSVSDTSTLISETLSTKNRINVPTLKIEVERGKKLTEDQKSPAYMIGLPCADTWYPL